jgi:hypothetical protein
MIGRILFLSAAAFVAYRYIGRSNKKVQQQLSQKPGSIDILPAETTRPSLSAEAGTPARRLSPAAEDLSRR